MEKVWLIKIKDMIEGPFSWVELKNKLESQSSLAGVEVNKPFMQWVPVENCSELDKLINKNLLPKKKKTFLDSTVKKIGSVGPFKKLERPKEENLHEDDDITVVQAGGGFELKEAVKEETFLNEEKTAPRFQKEDSSDPSLKGEWVKNQQELSPEEGGLPKDLDSAEEVEFFENHPSAGADSKKHKSIHGVEARFESLENSRQKAKLKARYFINALFGIVLALAFVPLAAFYPNLPFFNNSSDLGEKNTHSLFFARNDFKIGDFEKALEGFKKEGLLLSDEDYLTLASLRIKLDGDAYNAGIDLEKAKDVDSGKKALVEGVIAYEDQNFSKAEMFFEQAAEQMQDPSLALLNKAVLQAGRGERGSALETIDIILNDSVLPEKLSLISFLKVLWTAPDFNEESDMTLENLVQNGLALSQEASFLSLYKDFMENGQVLSYSQTAEVLDRDPYLTLEHRFDILSYTALWEDFLVQYCSSMYEQSGGQSFFLALFAFCKAKSGSLTSADAHIEKAASQSPKNSLIQALYGFILMENNLSQKAEIHIETALRHNENDSLILPFIIKARLCESQKDFDCSLKYWKKTEDKNPNLISAKAGAALALFHTDKKDLSQQKLNEGLKLAENYKPLLRLKSIFSESEKY